MNKIMYILVAVLSCVVVCNSEIKGHMPTDHEMENYREKISFIKNTEISGTDISNVDHNKNWNFPSRNLLNNKDKPEPFLNKFRPEYNAMTNNNKKYYQNTVKLGKYPKLQDKTQVHNKLQNTKERRKRRTVKYSDKIEITNEHYKPINDYLNKQKELERNNEESQAHYENKTKKRKRNTDEDAAVITQKPNLQSLILNFFGPEKIIEDYKNNTDNNDTKSTNTNKTIDEHLTTTSLENNTGSVYRFQDRHTLGVKFRNFVYTESPVSTASLATNNEPPPQSSVDPPLANLETTERIPDKNGSQPKKTSVIIYIAYLFTFVLLFCN